MKHHTTFGLAKNWLDVMQHQLLIANHQQQSAGLYKFGDINNNGLSIINLTVVPADGNSNTSSSPSRGRYVLF